MTDLWPAQYATDPVARAWDAAVAQTRQASVQRVGLPAPEGWRDWLEALFPNHVRWGFAEHHEALWEWVDGIEPESSPLPFAAVWSRGGGKSSSAELAVTYLGVQGRRKYVLYIRDTQDRADDSVGNIAALLESEAVARHYPAHARKLLNKFGDSRGWRRNRLRTEGGLTIDALGLDVAARGVKLEDQRPDLEVYDDVDSKHDSPSTTAKKIETITTSILPAGAANAGVLVIQNLIIPDGVVARMVDGRADYLAQRIVSGPHPALSGMEWEYEDQPGGQRLAIITAGTPTWEGQGLAVCQKQVHEWGIGAFLKEAQHDVMQRREGLALNYDPARHDEALTDDECRTLVGMGQAIGGMDFGAWRFSFVLRAVDRAGVVHQVAEYFSQRELIEDRARVIHALCVHYGAAWAGERSDGATKLRIYGDSANPTDIAEINAAFRRIGSPLRVIGVGRDAKLLQASVERINDALGRDALKYRVDVAGHSQRAAQAQWKALGYAGQPPVLTRWRLGMDAGSQGVEMQGSRLGWELRHWSYPVPKPGEVQAQVPDDNTADGADAIDADRYALMSFWKPAKAEPVAERRVRTHDTGLEQLLARAAEEQRRLSGGGGGLTRKGG